MQPRCQAAVIGCIEMSTGIGLTIAPVIGSLLYSMGGFTCPFYVFGVLFIIMALIIRSVLPDQVNVRFSDTSAGTNSN